MGRGDPEFEVSVLVVSYCTRALTLACLESLYSQPQGVSFEVVVVDNASNDGSAEAIASAYPQARLIALDENIGFGRASNIAARASDGEYVLLLNPDTEVPAGLLERMVAFERAHPDAGLVGGRTKKPDGTPDPSSCWGAFTLWSVTCFATGLSTIFKKNAFFDPESMGSWQRDSVRKVGVVTGCLLLARRTLWDELGGFDPRYFMFGEDFDLSARAIDLGYTPMITPDATIMHVLSASTTVRADRLVLMSKARMTIMQQRWRPAARRLGVVMYSFGVWFRGAAARVGELRSGGRTERAWAPTWQRRREWSAGYPEFDATRDGLAIEREGAA
jgi:N-acetylglucosaminyl-diphospho-decaprenol L-rhamnosyltransferase